MILNCTSLDINYRAVISVTKWMTI